MAGQIPEQEKTKRSHVLLELDERRRQEYMEGFFGKELEVLMEEEVEIDGVRYWTGTHERISARCRSFGRKSHESDGACHPVENPWKRLSDVGNDTNPEDLIEKRAGTKKFVALFEGSW